MSRKAVFLDRDGVVNLAIVKDGRPFPPGSLAELRINPDAFIALPLLKSLGFSLIVVTNQPDVSRGTQTREAIEAIHTELRSQLPLDDFFTCYHDQADLCQCRKPLPGLILEAASRHEITLGDSFLIGDRWRDVDAGFAAGVRTVWIDYAYRERGPAHPPSARVPSLLEAGKWIESVVNSR
jgi:D-glycero-D-manno-heptose 1,7-bisphosphate phosphatase